MQQEIVIKILLAFTAGVVIGLDRETSGKVAGVRTQMLICVGSALLASISVNLKDVYFAPESVVRIDPARLMAQVVTGIGFVGAGVILKSDKKVVGVTTAATIWATAAIGIAIGTGFYLPALVSTLLVLSLEPLARLQYAYGLKVNPYVLKVNKEKRHQVVAILEDLKIREKRRKLKGDALYLIILSSTQKNRKLELKLNEKNIEFEIEESEADVI